MSSDRRSFQIGVLLGLLEKPKQTADRQPVAYLYNGVRLPPLPKDDTDYDEEKNPYAAICSETNSDTPLLAYLVLSTVPLKYNEWVLGRDLVATAQGSLIVYMRNASGDGVPYDFWERNEDKDVEAFDTGDYVFMFTSKLSPIWANYTFMNNGGGVYLEASEPIPVYE